MKNPDLKRLLHTPEVYSAGLVCFALFQLISFLVHASEDSSPDSIVLTPSANFSIILFAVSIATGIRELQGLQILRVPIYVFLFLQMILDLLSIDAIISDNTSTVPWVSFVVAIVLGVWGLVQFTITIGKYLREACRLQNTRRKFN